jgi:hypothetical protein
MKKARAMTESICIVLLPAGLAAQMAPDELRLIVEGRVGGHSLATKGGQGRLPTGVSRCRSP